MGEAFHAGMLAKNVYGDDYGMSQTALRPSKNGASEAIFRFNV